MTTLVINGKKVKVSDDFLNLSPEEQNSTVDEIAKSLGSTPNAPAAVTATPKPDAMTEGLAALSGMSQNPIVQTSELPMSGQDILAASSVAPAG